MGKKIRLYSFLFLCLLVLSVAKNAHSGPWIDPGDERIRHHLTVLSDAGLLQAPITTWPVMWGAVASDLAEAHRAELTGSVRWSLDYVRFSYKQAKRPAHFGVRLGARSDIDPFQQFSSDQRDETELQAELDWIGKRFAARMVGTWVKEPFDGEEFLYDGSYFASLIGNWSASVGAVDRWWGPGWQNSLILSSSARPIDALMLQRNFSEVFDFPVLEWLGPWTLTAFAGELESDRTIANAKLLGLRLGIKPLPALEIGFSRTAQWGGEGRPDSLSSLWNLMLGRDNVGDDGISETNEPGNQLGAIDWRLGGSLFGTHSALYMQYVGEDESGGFPSRGFYLYGMEVAFATSASHNRIHLEYTETTVNGDRYNLAYEHTVYQDGYRYEQRPIGASYDNDSQVIAIAGAHYLANGDEITWRIADMKLNQDGTNRVNPSGSVYGDSSTNSKLVEISYGSVFEKFKVSATVSHLSDDVVWNNQNIKGSGVAIGFEYKI